MLISSLVVTLPRNELQSAGIRNAISALPVFQSGVQIGNRLPVVLEVNDGSQARYWYEWIGGLDGVVKVDLAFVSFDDDKCEHDVPEKVAQ